VGFLHSLGVALPKMGSSSICVLFGRADGQHACPQQFDTGTALHSPLECLQSVDLTFGLAVAPGFGDRIANCCEVLTQFPGETMYSIPPRSIRIVQPNVEFLGIVSAQDAAEIRTIPGTVLIEPGFGAGGVIGWRQPEQRQEVAALEMCALCRPFATPAIWIIGCSSSAIAVPTQMQRCMRCCSTSSSRSRRPSSPRRTSLAPCLAGLHERER
jgi:hypothetical protein